MKIRMPLWNVDEEIGSASESSSVEDTATAVETETASVTDTSEADVTKQQSFAHRLKESTEKALAEERAKWEKETSEKYKDYDTYRKATEYLQKTSGIDDVMTLKEQIELQELNERAEQQNVPPEVLKRIDELEQKAARGEELEKKQQAEEINNLFWKAAESFVEGKDVSKEDLNKYMIENDVFIDPTNPEAADRKFNMAYNAMKAEEYKTQLTTAKETAVKEYLQSKSAPKVEGSGSPGIVTEDTSKMDWKDINARIVARMNAANQST
ncbi:hypothetical protein [Paenibacillus sp. P32E]|uniref:hypothetical protein n=1 Tax=Paenibacillus sp. P32E TaxID=1349434 RepID=UPI00093A1CD0|nr:hypothetical protein [Paenibacillus sp. P32E]OKP91415.1 hypothetical protein A3848_09950 [Paenibacillus sp. P32E]